MICIDCKLDKAEDDFYFAHNGKREVRCKVCKVLLNREYRKNKTWELSPSTLVGKRILERQDIPSVTGAAGGQPYADLLAWGCVPLEVKITKERRGQYHWGIHHSNPSDIIYLLIVLTEINDVCSFVFPNELLWQSRRLKNKPKAITVNPKSTHANSLRENWELLYGHENAWHIIEERRLKYKPINSESIITLLNEAISSYESIIEKQNRAGRARLELNSAAKDRI